MQTILYFRSEMKIFFGTGERFIAYQYAWGVFLNSDGFNKIWQRMGIDPEIFRFSSEYAEVV